VEHTVDKPVNIIYNKQTEDTDMRIQKTIYKTQGINSIGIAGAVVLAGVVFGTITPWWLAVALPALFLSAGYELQEKTQ
jgi:Na+/H+ antiporter NhaC